MGRRWRQGQLSTPTHRHRLPTQNRRLVVPVSGESLASGHGFVLTIMDKDQASADDAKASVELDWPAPMVRREGFGVPPTTVRLWHSTTHPKPTPTCASRHLLLERSTASRTGA